MTYRRDGVPDFLAIGHVTDDLRDGRSSTGGTAAYAALAASRLGMRSAVLTSCAGDVDFQMVLPGVEVVSLPSPVTMTFENTYEAGTRRQRIHKLADAISPDRLPRSWGRCPIVLLGLVANDVDPTFACAFPDSLLGISPQGWLRRWDSNGRVSRGNGPAPGVVDRADVVVLSERDTESEGMTDDWMRDRAVHVVTLGSNGAVMTWRGNRFKVPPYPAIEVDPTGAGDIFVAAYLISYYRNGDPFASALFASCAASLSVEADGLAGVPTAEQVQERIARFPGLRVSPL